MKKLFFLIAIVALFASCVDKTEIRIDGETGRLVLVALVEETKSSVNRNDVPVYVDGLNITITGEDGYKTTEIVNYVDNGGADEIYFDETDLKANSIEVSSIPVHDCNLPIRFFVTGNQNLVDTTLAEESREDLLAYFAKQYKVKKSLVPYAEYYGKQTFSMQHGADNKVNVTLDTSHGRDFGSIVNYSDYKVKVDIEVLIPGSKTTWSKTFEPNSPEAIHYYWGNEDAIHGTEGIKIKYTWFDARNKVIKSAQGVIVIEAKKSYMSVIGTTNSGIYYGGLGGSFRFKEIEEVGDYHGL